MKQPAVIRARIARLLVMELRRQVAEAEERLPTQCAHNYRHPLDLRKTVDGEANANYNRIRSGGQTLGLCMLGAEDPAEWQGTICEEPIDAVRCPYFTPKHSKQELWQELKLQLQDPLWAERNLPEVAALAWTLNENPDVESAAELFELELNPPVKVEEPERTAPTITPPPPSSWWHRLWLWLFRKRQPQPLALPPKDLDS